MGEVYNWTDSRQWAIANINNISVLYGLDGSSSLEDAANAKTRHRKRLYSVCVRDAGGAGNW